MVPAGDAIAFRWSDAWLLLAAGMASEAGRPTITRVIAAADAVQHAIPAKEELDGGIGRLRRAGYVELGPDGLHVTAAGRRLLARAGGAKRTYLAQQDALERALGARPWSAGDDPREARGDEPEALSQAEYDAAVRRYVERWESGGG